MLCAWLLLGLWCCLKSPPLRCRWNAHGCTSPLGKTGRHAPRLWQWWAYRRPYTGARLRGSVSTNHWTIFLAAWESRDAENTRWWHGRRHQYRWLSRSLYNGLHRQSLPTNASRYQRVFYRCVRVRNTPRRQNRVRLHRRWWPRVHQLNQCGLFYLVHALCRAKPWLGQCRYPKTHRERCICAPQFQFPCQGHPLHPAPLLHALRADQRVLAALLTQPPPPDQLWHCQSRFWVSAHLARSACPQVPKSKCHFHEAIGQWWLVWGVQWFLSRALLVCRACLVARCWPWRGPCARQHAFRWVLGKYRLHHHPATQSHAHHGGLAHCRKLQPTNL